MLCGRCCHIQVWQVSACFTDQSLPSSNIRHYRNVDGRNGQWLRLRGEIIEVDAAEQKPSQSAADSWRKELTKTHKTATIQRFDRSEATDKNELVAERSEVVDEDDAGVCRSGDTASLWRVDIFRKICEVIVRMLRVCSLRRSDLLPPLTSWSIQRCLHYWAKYNNKIEHSIKCYHFGQCIIVH